MIRTVRLLVATVALALLTAAPAYAETSPPTATPTPPPAEGTYIEYQGDWLITSFDETGQTQEQTPIPLTVRISCAAANDCQLSGIYFGKESTFPITGASGDYAVGASGSVCSSNNDPYYGAGTMTVTATATAISITQAIQISAHEFCPSETWQWGSNRTYDGVYVSGDACVLEGAPCPPEPVETAVPVASGASAGASRTPAEPSVLSALATPDQTLSPGQIAVAAALTVVLVILMAIPTHLLNTAVETGSGRVSQWLARRRPQDAPAPATPKGKYPGLLPAAGGVLAAGVISAFVDPRLGFDAASVRVVFSVLVSFAIEVVLGWFVLIWLVKRTHPTASASFRFAPATLLVVVATVLFTRITAFEPGIVFGLVAGVAFGTALATAEKARVALLGLGYAFALAIIAWVAYALLGAVADPNAILVFIRETLSSVTIAGIAALPIALIPLRGLTGFEVWSWNRIAWGVAYAVGLLGFFLVLMPMPFSWGGVHASLWTWVGLYLAYAAVAILVWLVVTRPWQREKSGTNEA